jgi:hypothetical protein
MVSQGRGDGLAGSSYDLDKVEVSGVYRLSRAISIEIGLARDLAGERVGLGHAVLGGLWVRF